jgi:tetratricopeptide (TPR) repeat protein
MVHGQGSPDEQGNRQALEAVERGVKHLENDQCDQAIDSLTLAIGLWPAAANAYFVRARAYDGRGDSALAIADCTELIRLNPECAAAYSLRGQIYEKMGNWAKAERDSAKARRIEARQQ